MSQSEPLFDEFADEYVEALERGLSVSGESSDYFASGRVAWLAKRLARLGLGPRTVMDFGCGVGGAVPHLHAAFAPERIVCVDTSRASLERARQLHAGLSAEFVHPDDYTPAGSCDLVFTNGVFHHIEPSRRALALDYVRRSLRPGGVFALWENNPWNPGTRLVMSRIPFDRDAVLVWPREARRLVRAAELKWLSTDFVFYFPRALRALRRIEPSLCKLPLGAQYLVLSRK